MKNIFYPPCKGFKNSCAIVPFHIFRVMRTAKNRAKNHSKFLPVRAGNFQRFLAVNLSNFLSLKNSADFLLSKADILCQQMQKSCCLEYLGQLWCLTLKQRGNVKHSCVLLS